MTTDSISRPPGSPSPDGDAPNHGTPDDRAPDIGTTTAEANADARLPRREFVRLAGLGTGALLAGSLTGAAVPRSLSAASSPHTLASRRGDGDSHVVVIGAGAWGGWTAYHLRALGHRVTLVDAYGPANSRATSGDETRGIRSSYGDRAVGEQWVRWAREAITRWEAFDAEFAKPFGTRFFVKTGDVILRPKEEPFITRTLEFWKAQNVPHEQLDGDEVRKRYPVIKADDITIAITEPDAGVARSRHATQAVVAIAQDRGAELVIGRARLGPIVNGALESVLLADGTRITGDRYVFACGPWLRGLFPELLGNRMRVPLGYVCYFGTPVADERFTVPNLPSYNFPGVTGWAALPVDSRGFRVRGAVAPPAPPVPDGQQPPPRTPSPPADPAQQDPDTSVRWANEERVAGSRRFLEQRFPLLADMPLLETRACHYESSINRNFIIDHVPETTNAWIAGVGQAEGFKFGPVVGEYIARRVTGADTDPALADAFRLPTDEYDPPPESSGDEDE